MTVTDYRAGVALPVRFVTAKNFAFESDNRIHADDVAAQYGFKGGLVPGVGVFAYMTQPVVAALRREWLQRGSMSGRFVKPVYHQERVSVHAVVENESPLRLRLEARNADGEVCGIGEASLPAELPEPPRPADYPRAAMPATAERRPARITSLPEGTVLGSLDFEAHWQRPVEGPDPFVDAVCDPLPIYRGEDAACHPALIAARANQLLKENVALGPWIHTSSAVQFFELPREGALVALRGRVAKSFEKRGHEFVELDLTLFDAGERALAHIVHAAIIRPARR